MVVGGEGGGEREQREVEAIEGRRKGEKRAKMGPGSKQGWGRGSKRGEREGVGEGKGRGWGRGSKRGEREGVGEGKQERGKGGG